MLKKSLSGGLGRNFQLLTAAGVVSQLGDWASRIAIAVIVLEDTGSPAAVGATAALFLVPWMGPGQLLGRLVTRWPRKKILFVSDLTRAAIFASLAIGVPLWLLLVLAFVAGTIDPVFESNRAAMVFDITDEDDYGDAVATSASVMQVANLAGLAMGGTLISTIGINPTLLVNAASFAISASLVSLLRPAPSEHEAASVGSLQATLNFLRNDRISLVMFVASLVLLVFTTGVENQAPVFAVLELDAGARAVGLLAAIVPLGALASLRWVPRNGDDAAVSRRGMLVAIISCLIAAPLLFAAPHFGTAVGLALATVGYGFIGFAFILSSFGNLVVGRRLPEATRATVFAVLQGAIVIANSLGSVLIGFVAEVVGAARGGSGALMLSAIAIAVFSRDRSVRDPIESE